MMRVLVFLTFYWFVSAHQLHLASDLRQDRRRLRAHGAIITDADFNRLKVFDQYAAMNLSGFVFKDKKFGSTVISKWYGKNKLEIYQIDSTLPADSSYIEQNISTGTTDTIKLKNGFFNFRTYIIRSLNHQQLIYSRQINGGLHYFKIGRKVFTPVYEDVSLGIRYPKEKEMLTLIKQM
jgi:hypothetical protein